MLSLYLPGESLVHRAPAGLKLGLLAALGVGLFLTERPAVVAGALAGAVAVGVAVAGLPWRALAVQVRPVWLWLALLLAFHLVVTDVRTGTVAVLRLLALLVAAAVVTATTRVTALVAVVERLASPLRLVGVRPARIGLVLAMTLRFIPLVAEQAAGIREAQAARGADRLRWGMAVPLLVKVLRTATTVGEALDARGADERPVRRASHRPVAAS